MISSKDRSYYIGASDTPFVVGNWNTKTFDKWYGTKLGIYTMDYISTAMRTGTAYEHRILDSLEIHDMQKDNQIISGRLRVNLDGNTNDTIYEVKTVLKKPNKVPLDHLEQVNVEMYGFDIRRAYILYYEVSEAEYNNFYLDIDKSRLSMFPVEYDGDFINKKYLPRFEYLSGCMDKGVFPKWIFPARLSALLETL